MRVNVNIETKRIEIENFGSMEYQAFFNSLNNKGRLNGYKVKNFNIPPTKEFAENLVTNNPDIFTSI